MFAKLSPTGPVQKSVAVWRLAALVVFLSALSASRTAHAQTTWVGDASQDWNVAANWSSDPADPTGNFIVNTATAGAFPIYSADGTFFPVDIFIGNGVGATGRLDQTGGNLAAGSTNWLRIGEGGGATGTFNLSGGTFTGRVHMARVGGVAGTATINVTGSSILNSPGELVVSDGQNATATAQGTLNVGTGATVNSEGDLIAAFAGNASSFGEVNIATGATVNVATATKRWMIVNQWDSQQGRVNVNGGTLNLNAVTDLRFSPGNGTGTSSVNLNSGAINMQAGSELDFNRGSSVGVNNTFNLNGGVLTVGRIMRFNTTAGAATRVFNFNGGTLTPAASVTNFFDVDSVTAANVRNGGAKFATNGFDVTVAQSLQHSNVGGDNAIDGGLTKSGAGALTLSSALNSYTGPTVVSGGTLNVAGLSATSGVSVAAGAAFGGSGAVAGTTTLNGGTLTNSNPVTPLTLGALSFGASGNTINLNLSTAAPGIAVTGALTTGGRTATINATKAVWTNGTQNLVSFGSFSGALGNFTLAPLTGLNARQNAGPLTNTGTGLAVTISGDNPKWTGGDNGNWVVGATGANKNWRLVLGGGTTDYIQGDAVVFDDSATGTTTIDITSASGVSPTTVNFNNSTKAYTINGAAGGGISGSALLVKDGTNSVTLNSANSYTGSTTVNAGTLNLNGANTTTGATTLNGGTLNLGNATALSSGPLTIGAGSAKVLNNTSGSDISMTANSVQTWNDDFTFTGTNSLDMGTGDITMAGAGTVRTINVAGGTLAGGELKAAAHGLTKTGAGTLALTSTGPNVAGSNIAGTLTVTAGTVQMNRTGATGGDAFTGDLYVTGLAGSGAITNGAAQTRWIFVDQAVSTTSTFNGTFDNGPGGAGMGILKRGLGTLILGGASTMTDQVTIENGTLGFTGAGSLANASAYVITAGAGVFQVNSSTRIGAAAINIQSNGSGVIEPGSGSTARLELSGNSTLTNPISLSPRNDSNGSDAIRNVSGNNTLSGLVTITTGGNYSRLRSEAGLLTVAGGITTTAGSVRNVILQGAGNGEVSGQILDGSASINIFKEGAGTWTLSNVNSNTGITGAFGGILRITQPDGISDLGDISVATGGILDLANGADEDVIDSLWLNGVAQQPGIYGSLTSSAPNKTALITGSGTLNVTRYDLPGDFDNNNIVDAADLAVWRNGVTVGNSTGDTDGDGDSDGNDFLIWQRFLGATASAPVSGAVPEPTACMLLLMGSLGAIATRRAGMGRRAACG